MKYCKISVDPTQC